MTQRLLGNWTILLYFWCRVGSSNWIDNLGIIRLCEKEWTRLMYYNLSDLISAKTRFYISLKKIHTMKYQMSLLEKYQCLWEEFAYVQYVKLFYIKLSDGIWRADSGHQTDFTCPRYEASSAGTGSLHFYQQCKETSTDKKNTTTT